MQGSKRASAASTSPAGAGARASSSNGTSPPPAKKAKVPDMFVPMSQRAPPRFRWRSSNDCEAGVPTSSLLCGTHGEPRASSKIAAFDLDGTLIKTKSGNKFPAHSGDWQWWDASVRPRLVQCHNDGYTIVILTNQGFTGKRAEKVIDAFKDKLPLIARSLGDDVPFHVLVARAYDRFRKPLPGMWHHFTRSHNDGVEINMEQSFYVGDAAGRNGDHSCVDRQLAYNVSLPFHTPEEFFRASPQSSAWRWPGKFDAATYDHDGPLFTPTSTPLVPRSEGRREPEVILFVGPPAVGKSSLYHEHLKPLGYVHINQDTLKSRDRCIREVAKELEAGNPVVVDNTNRDRATRAYYVSLVRDKFPAVPIRVFHFTAPIALARHNNLYRIVYDLSAGRENIPEIAYTSFASSFERPELNEGFEEIKQINFAFRGTPEQRRSWEGRLLDK